jgi:hypothetical protein
MLRIKGTNAQFLAELFYFIWLLAVMLMAWQRNALLLAAMLFGVIVALVFWHTREDLLFFVIGAFAGTLVQVIATGTGILRYANPGALQLPYWLPLFFGGIVLFSKRFKDSFFEMEHWKKHYEKLGTLRDFESQIFPEMLYVVLLALVLRFLTYSNIAASLFMAILLALQLLRWHAKEDWLYALILLIIGTLIEVISTNIGIWQWKNPALMNVPAWTGVMYAYVGLVIRRICLTLNHRLLKGRV